MINWISCAKWIKRSLLGLIILVILLGLLWVGFCAWFGFQVKKSEPAIKETIAQEIGIPTKLGSIEFNWQGLFFEFSIKDITLIDPEVPVPFIHIAKAEVVLNPFEYFWHQKIEFKKLYLDKMKIVLGKEKEGSINFRGLKNEVLPSNIDFKVVLAALAKGKLLEIKQAEILWLLGGTEVKEWIDGDFYWLNSKEKAFSFEGSHQIQVGQSEKLPKVPLALNIYPDKNQGSLKTGQENFKMETTFFETKNGMTADCELSIQDLELNALSKYFVLNEKSQDKAQDKVQDPAWAIWLVKAIQGGKIPQGKLKLTDLFQKFRWTGNMEVQNGQLRYHDKWPTIDNIQGKLVFDETDLTVLANKSDILGTPTDPITTKITNLGKVDKETHILVKGSLQGKIEKGVAFILQTPLKQKMGDSLVALDPKGNMQLKLELDVPLNEKETLVNGDLLTTNVSVTMPNDKTRLPINGSFHFTQNKLEAKIEEFQISDLNLNKTILSLDTSSKEKRWKMEGPNMKGTLSIPSKGNIKVNLDFLKLNHQENSSVSPKALLEENKLGIEFDCQDFRFNDTQFGRVQFSLAPGRTGYNIDSLSISNSAYYLKGKGQWNWGEKMQTTLSGDLLSTNMGEAFKQLGYPTMMRGARGSIKYNLSWPGSLIQFNIQNAEGNAYVKLSQGRILGVDPGLGRIFGLLNVENIKRRLKLDFRDVYKKGFVYDSLTSNLQLSKGVFYVKDLVIGGPAANIEMQGRAQIKDKLIDLKMIVIPKLGGGLPLAASLLAANPLAGAGVWMIDKVVGSKIIRHYYHVTGTLDSPHIDEIGYSSFKK